MNTIVVFTERNIKEIFRDFASWIFGVLLPIAILIIMQIVVKSIPDEALPNTTFALNKFIGGVLIFGFSFLTLFCSLLLARDRTSAFLTRLYASPMKSSSYIMGYTLSIFPIAIIQVILTFIVALCFGLEFSANIFLAIVISIPSILLFVGLGLLIGSFFTEKAAPGVSSILVQVAVLLSGMWFNLKMIGGGFNLFCHILPFAHTYDAIAFTLAGEYSKLLLPVGVSTVYAIIVFALVIFVFNRKAKKQKMLKQTIYNQLHM